MTASELLAAEIDRALAEWRALGYIPADEDTWITCRGMKTAHLRRPGSRDITYCGAVLRRDPEDATPDAPRCATCLRALEGTRRHA